MIHNCEIVNIDEEEVTIKVGGTKITGFCNMGVLKPIGVKVIVDISLYDDLKITQSDTYDKTIKRKDNTFAYSLYGTLDVEKCILESEIDFDIDKEELFNYGYLDGKNVRIDTIRIDMDFNI